MATLHRPNNLVLQVITDICIATGGQYAPSPARLVAHAKKHVPAKVLAEMEMAKRKGILENIIIGRYYTCPRQNSLVNARYALLVAWVDNVAYHA